MSTLTTRHRRLLESTIKRARGIATDGAGKALEALAVHEPAPYRHMDEKQRDLRRRLRAQARQLGDGESHSKPGAYEIKHLIEQLAYDQWHSILFVRFLLENHLLISPEHGVAVSLDDCGELAPSLMLEDAWAVAARFAAVELPEIFRADHAAGAVQLPVEDRKLLIALAIDLPVEVFTASDSLGWCYQFWQAVTKDAVNKSGNKIGAYELPSVTQLFTEDYMVDFLLDNTLGAWWAGKRIQRMKDDGGMMKAETEEEARAAVALPGCEWKFLRFVQSEAHESSDANSSSFIIHPSSFLWSPAAGSFSGWPMTASRLTCLDPCMGSGHFVVAMFERLVALRVAEEKLDETTAVAAVIRDNLFGLEIDPRCSQIGAFNLALAAWRRVGHCKLPPMNLACSGLAPNTKLEDWLAMVEKSAGDGRKADPLKAGMERLYRLFHNAPVLGSLINPRAVGRDVLADAFHELQPLLEQAMAREDESTNPQSSIHNPQCHKMAVTARGLAKAAEILAGQFTLVATNVPYLGRGKQDDVLQDYCERVYPESKTDLATCFVERCIEFCASHATAALVTPQNWLFLGSYKELRMTLLKTTCWNFIARLGCRAFETPMYDFNVMLAAFSRRHPDDDAAMIQWDVGMESITTAKANALHSAPHFLTRQIDQLLNPDTRVTLEEPSTLPRLGKYVFATEGLSTGDRGKFIRCFWETHLLGDAWSFYQTSPSSAAMTCGFSNMLFWQDGKGELSTMDGARIQGDAAWNKTGILVGRVGGIRSAYYAGQFFDKSNVVMVPYDPGNLPALAAFCFSDALETESRKLDQKLGLATSVLEKIPFDLARWQMLAAEKYPHGLPKPFSSDPTQWLFNGHPAGADRALHVAVARLLGYQWPRQTGSGFPESPALGPDGLEPLADADGIVCLPATHGRAPAAVRLRALLMQALGTLDLPALLAGAGLKASKSQTLDDWLRDEFFQQHCEIFHHRPFIWHLWDGHKDGFSTLVNYHKLTHANLETLTYAYLGDWIRRQQAAVDAGEDGGHARLQAANQLQAKLILILEGEPPYDIFVRWKRLAAQAIGWNPDLNDGVRMNIRPFATADILRKRVKIKWEKDRGKEPPRDKNEFPWFWNGSAFTGDRINHVYLSNERKQRASP